jgi:hypothetical protein
MFTVSCQRPQVIVMLRHCPSAFQVASFCPGNHGPMGHQPAGMPAYTLGLLLFLAMCIQANAAAKTKFTIMVRWQEVWHAWQLDRVGNYIVLAFLFMVLKPCCNRRQKGRAFPGHVLPPFWPCYISPPHEHEPGRCLTHPQVPSFAGSGATASGSCPAMNGGSGLPYTDHANMNSHLLW